MTPARRVVTLGETMALVSAAAPGSFVTNRDLRLSVAGSESNVAIGVARLGGAASWISRVGDDGFGDLIRRELRAEGVHAVVTVDPARPTGLMVKERPNAMRTRIRYYRVGSAASALSAADVPEELVASAAVLHVTGITPALGDGPADAVSRAVAAARAAGVPVSIDVNYRSALWSAEEAGRVLGPLVRSADILFAGPEEAALLVPAGKPVELARRLGALGPAQVLVKMGADGVVAQVDGIEYSRPAIPVPVVDTVGAGDAFVAGYLTELVAGAPVEARLDTAVAAGAAACTTLGDWEGLPTRADLAALGSDGDPVAR